MIDYRVGDRVYLTKPDEQSLDDVRVRGIDISSPMYVAENVGRVVRIADVTGKYVYVYKTEVSRHNGKECLMS